MEIVGRKREWGILQDAYESNAAEFIAVYGRRRVGKTFLVRAFAQEQSDALFFYVTGTLAGSMDDQIKNFLQEMASTFLYKGARLHETDWNGAFQALNEYIRLSKKSKILLFFDEFPWMVTKRSRLLETLEYFWNRHWSMDARIKLIICGSSSGWILKNIINNRGGLYNRVTHSIHVKPFNLAQAKQFFSSRNIMLQEKDIADIYMVLGGVPYYLAKVKKGLSVARIIDDLAFQESSFLLEEFDNLYATLFDGKGAHVELARKIARYPYGIGQEALIKEVEGLSSGGTVVKWLRELEEAGFISRFVPYKSQRRGTYYKMEDEYSLFYFYWIEPIKNALIKESLERGYWRGLYNTQEWKVWSGYAFETLCFKHVRMIRRALALTPDALAYTWRYIPAKGSAETGAQVDLLFDRKDNVVTICEIKYTQEPYVLSKEGMQKINRKIEIFKKVTKVRKNIFVAFVSATGLKKTLYSEEYVQNTVTLEDLFAEII